MALTTKQQRFVEEYLVDHNATQAAIRAGYSERTACEQASRLLANVKVKAALREAVKKQSERTQITADRVIQELARIGFADSRKVFEWGPEGVKVRPSKDLDDETAAAVAEVSETRTDAGGTIRVKLADKVAALTLLGKHFGAFTDKTEITGKDGGDIVVKVLGAGMSMSDL
jgi:phage terminase small subunit